MDAGNDRDAPGAVSMRFPESGSMIRTLFDRDAEFRELCEDYAECTAVLARLRREQGPEDPRIEEYGELCVSIGQELQRKIKEQMQAVKLIALSGLRGQDTRAKALEST